MKRNNNQTEERDLPFSDPKRVAFYKKHGDFVGVDGTMLFEDGAREEQSCGIRMVEPSKNQLQLAQLIRKYWEVKATRATNEFTKFQNYLEGSGVCPAGIKTDEQKLDHLKKLQKTAKVALKKLRQAEGEVDAESPHTEVTKARESQKKSKLLQQARAIRL